MQDEDVYDEEGEEGEAGEQADDLEPGVDTLSSTSVSLKRTVDEADDDTASKRARTSAFNSECNRRMSLGRRGT